MEIQTQNIQLLKIRPYLESLGLNDYSKASSNQYPYFLKLIHKKHYQPLTIAMERFKGMLSKLTKMEIINKKTKTQVRTKLIKLFKTLEKRSIYGEGFMDPLFSEIALSLFSLYAAKSNTPKILIRGDFVNGRGLMKLLRALEPDLDELLASNTFLEKAAQSARKKLLDWLKEKGIKENSVLFLATPGDEMLILIDNLPSEASFYSEFETKLNEINQNLKEESEQAGFMSMEHFKDKDPPQKGFGLVLQSKLIKSQTEIDAHSILDEIDKKISDYKKRHYSVGADESLSIRRKDILLHSVPDDAEGIIRDQNTIEEQAEFSSIRTFEAYRALSKELEENLSNDELEKFLASLDAFIRLKMPETKVSPLWDLENSYRELCDNLDAQSIKTRPRLLSLWACGLATLNTLSRTLGEAFVKKVSGIIENRMKELGYTQKEIQNSVFNRSAANFEVLLSPFCGDKSLSDDELAEKEISLMKYFKDEIYELTTKNLEDLASEWKKDLNTGEITIPDRLKKVPLCLLKSPKSYYVGTRKVDRYGLWTVTKSSGPVEKNDDFQEIRKKLSNLRLIISREQKKQLLEEELRRLGT